MSSHLHTRESKFELRLADGKKINGILRGNLSDESPVVVMMHGRTGHANQLLQYLAAHHLYEQGITSLRLSMYDFGQAYRSVFDCTLDTHISDFDTVVKHLREQGVKKLFALGHSYGGLTILGSQSNLEGAVLWDPSHGLIWQDSTPKNPEYPEKKLGEVIICTSGPGYLLPATQGAYDEKLGDTTSWAKDKPYPMKFILAGAGRLAKYARLYYEAAPEPKAVAEIADAHHQFEDSDEVIEQLLKETATWIKQYSE